MHEKLGGFFTIYTCIVIVYGKKNLSFFILLHCFMASKKMDQRLATTQIYGKKRCSLGIAIKFKNGWKQFKDVLLFKQDAKVELGRTRGVKDRQQMDNENYLAGNQENN